MLGGTAGLMLTAVPCYALIQSFPSTGMAMFVQTIWALCMAAIGGPMSAWFIEFFPPLVRYCAVGIGYNISQAIFGGTAPLIATTLISCHCCAESLAPMVWVSTVALISALGIYAARIQVLSAHGLWHGGGGEDEGGGSGCPTSMAKAGPLLTVSAVVSVVLLMSAVAATNSVENIAVDSDTGAHCATLESTFCQRRYDSSGQCTLAQGCVEPHDAHELAGCVCARHEVHAEQEAGGASFGDVLFFVLSLIFVALALWAMCGDGGQRMTRMPPTSTLPAEEDVS